jgi:hypothetical protein
MQIVRMYQRLCGKELHFGDDVDCDDDNHHKSPYAVTDAFYTYLPAGKFGRRALGVCGYLPVWPGSLRQCQTLHFQ